MIESADRMCDELKAIELVVLDARTAIATMEAEDNPDSVNYYYVSAEANIKAAIERLKLVQGPLYRYNSKRCAAKR